MSNWIHKRPRNYLPTTKQLLGPPTFLANVEYGMAYWKLLGNNLYAEHMLKDEDVKHCVPKPHHDFFYTSLKIYVPPSKLEDVLAISGSVNYDGLKHLLTARCASIDANIATLYLSLKVAMGEYTIKEVKRAGLYASHIHGEAVDSRKPKVSLSHDEMEKELRRMKKINHRQYKKQLKLHRYPLAFGKC
uniref:Uncharacterized protein n=1 Tax=Marseillevirus LCMAC201 TaxID=2506605 RepID=A0A481YVI5_9VIRU|nr:MAG: uncharacterized protein LCMAC201_02130 [Marseillevirus LCMAC201]